MFFLRGGAAEAWNLNTNAAWKFDVWLLNLFARETPFTANEGGYSTLSFIPTLGTMILGLLAGGWLQRGEVAAVRKCGGLILVGALLLAAGWGLGELGWIPVVKRIWTPSWVLFSGGWCCWLLAAFYFVIEIGRCQRWAWPLVVVGMNSIAAYLIAHLTTGFIGQAIVRHFGKDIGKSLGEVYEPVVLGAGILLVQWLLLAWMYRRKIFLRV
jgi:heparan-alpha-glucosaminide N-acetyltransferase